MQRALGKAMNTKTNFTSLLTTAAVVIVFASWMMPIQAAPDNHTERFTDYLDLVVPASDSCSGEDVYIYGPLEAMAQTTTDSDGGTHVVIHFTPHVTAIGLTTGETYHAVGPAQIVMNLSGLDQSAFALVDLIRVTSPGSEGNLTLTHTVHVTVNANGDTTVDVNNFSAACRG